MDVRARRDTQPGTPEGEEGDAAGAQVIDEHATLEARVHQCPDPLEAARGVPLVEALDGVELDPGTPTRHAEVIRRVGDHVAVPDDDPPRIDALLGEQVQLGLADGPARRVGRDGRAGTPVGAGSRPEHALPGRGVDVRNDVPPDLPTLPADRERLHQVLFNLIDNAVRFTPAGGSVTVSARRRNGSVEVAVSDTGAGISPEHLPRLFERFYRADPARARGDGGTGIGLAIARSVVEAHGGQIHAKSQPGRGSVFTFDLPAERSPS